MMDENEHEMSGGCAFILCLLLFCVILPITCVQKAYRKGRHVVVSTRMQNEDIILVALEEKNWQAIDATGCRGHLSPNPVATMDRGRRALHTVDEDYRLPEPWVTPKFVWVRKYDDGDVSYNAVYGVFHTPAQTQQWMDAHNYAGEFRFSLIKVKDDHVRDDPYAHATVPQYFSTQSQIRTVIFTNRYVIIETEVFDKHHEDELFQIYKGVAQ